MKRNMYLFIKHIIMFGFSVQTIFVCAEDVRLSSLFSNHMVLQREQVVPVWGQASAHERIQVHFAGQSKSTQADHNGNWSVSLDPMPASFEARDLLVSGKTKIVISDVLVGEVWICSGQSNMQFAANAVPEVKGLIPFTNHIRSFEVQRTVAVSEEDDVIGKWTTHHPNSAVAFSFAYFLKDISNVPVGIILTAWGSSSLEAWMPADMTSKFPYFKSIMDDFYADDKTQNKISNILSKGTWTNEEDIFLRRQPNILYNAMMKPLAPYASRGLVWYQGERNTRYLSGVPEVSEDNWYHRVAGMKEYGSILHEWILRYRNEWKNDKMNFLIVMLPGFGGGTVDSPNIDPEDPSAQSWAWMRESQMQVLGLAYTGIANTIDLGDVNDIHPKDKLPIGQRLALLASKNIKRSGILCEGPIMSRVDVLKNSIIVHFKNADGLKTTNGKEPSAFWLADESGQWKAASAVINENQIELSSPEIESPKYVRYAFAGKPNVNLVNRMELPAYPFRTDEFEK